MSFAGWVESRLRQRVAIALPAGEDAYGRDVAGVTHEDVPARIEPLTEARPVAEGSDVMVEARLWLAPDAPIAAGALVTYDGQSYRALKGGPMPDLDGAITHQEWALGSG